MQTFLVSDEFVTTAHVLDSTRLNYQINDCRKILEILFGHRNVRGHHPAVKMWAGYEESLKGYMFTLVEEWCERRSCLSHNSYEIIYDICGESFVIPRHLNDESLFRSHQARLLGKDYSWYSQFNWPVGPETDKTKLIWPVSPRWEPVYERT